MCVCGGGRGEFKGEREGECEAELFVFALVCFSDGNCFVFMRCG